ncbi:leucine-rich repeat protein [Acetivibrio sp. MSJd-27]|uniref:leucine-rich repeat protein n=1 Tax=Acetivibrio sp. MSJd-27 TaxID=2841523 RepID=UPI001C0F5784|nr:leucine-rich repeat protein [Acetivibrio sp. MSJd-27]MBU5450255.1 leucine-rich repeat protein [Acetivibrio sp. MSJd-27]
MTNYEEAGSVPPWVKSSSIKNNLENVVIEAGVESIGNYAFYGCSGLTSITIPDGVPSIGNKAFYGCESLTSVTIPNSVISIGEQAFRECTNLNKVYYIGSEAEWAAIEKGEKYSIDESIITYGKAEDTASGACGTNLTWTYDSSTKTLTISGTGAMDNYFDTPGSSVVGTGKVAPWRENEEINSSLEKVVVKNGVTTIGTYAFYEWPKLKEVVLPDSVKEIYSDAFSGCRSLQTINIDKVTDLSWDVFRNCTSLNDITLADGIEYLPCNTFVNCSSLTKINIPASLIDLDVDEELFYGCTALTEIDVAAENTEYSFLDGVLFNKDKTVLYKFPASKSLVGYTIPESVTEVSGSAFYECSKNAEYTNGLLIVGKWIVDAKSDDIPNDYVINVADSVTHIANSVFAGCKNLKNITVPKHITSIGSGAFWGRKLESISVSAENKNYSSLDEVLYDKGKTNLITYPVNKADSDFTAPATVKTVSEYAFGGNQNLRTVNLSGVEEIGDSAFANMDITEVTFLSSLKKIGTWAFSWCTELKKADLPEGVEYIGNSSFNNCEALENIKIPESVTFVGDYAFYYTSICDIKTKKDVYYHDNWLLYTRYDADLSENFEVQEGTVGICEGAFSYHDEITSVKLPLSIKYINDRAFAKVDGLTDIYYGGSRAAWANVVIGNDNEELKKATLYFTEPPEKSALSVTGTYVYTGSEQTAQVKGFDSQTMTISGNVQTNAGKYEITVAPKTAWSDGSTDAAKISWTIDKAKPTGKPSVALIKESGKTLADALLSLEAASLSVNGTVMWVADDGETPLDTTTVVEANKYYKWLFTPADKDNYETLTGTIKLYSKSTGGGTTRYTVTFETNGGSKLVSQSVTRNTAMKEPTAPTKEGFDFAGWYTDKELKTKYDFSGKVTKSFTLYAGWTEKDNSENQLILKIGEKSSKVFGKTKTNDVAPKIVNDRTMRKFFHL